MNAPVQWAVPVLLEQRKNIQRQLISGFARIWLSWTGNWRGRKFVAIELQADGMRCCGFR